MREFKELASSIAENMVGRQEDESGRYDYWGGKNYLGVHMWTG